MICLKHNVELEQQKRGTSMADITLPTNAAPITEPTPTTEETTEQAPTTDDIFLDEEIEEELIIEDFTIDGICGVY